MRVLVHPYSPYIEIGYHKDCSPILFKRSAHSASARSELRDASIYKITSLNHALIFLHFHLQWSI